MWYFLGLAVFKVELLAAEVGSKFKKKIDGKAALKKKDTAKKIKIVAVSFFLHFFVGGIFFLIWPYFEGQ